MTARRPLPSVATLAVSNYTDGNALNADDQDFTSSDDMRPFLQPIPGL